MIYKKYEINILIQLLIILGVCFLFAWSIVNAHLKFSEVYFGIILIIQVVILYQTIRNQSKKILDFLTAVKYDDSLLQLENRNVDKIHSQINQALNDMAEIVNKAKFQQQQEYEFFINVLRNLDIGLLAYNENGKIEFHNEKLLKLLEISSCANLAALNSKSDFGTYIQNLKAGNVKIFKLLSNNSTVELSIGKSIFKTDGNPITQREAT